MNSLELNLIRKEKDYQICEMITAILFTHADKKNNTYSVIKLKKIVENILNLKVDMEAFKLALCDGGYPCLITNSDVYFTLKFRI